MTLDDCCLYLKISKPTLKSDIGYINEVLQKFLVKIIQQELVNDIDVVLSLSYIELAADKPVIFLPLVLTEDNFKELGRF